MTYAKTAEAVARLTPEEYRVTQENGTERPWSGKYTTNKAPGIYVDVVSGEPLFASSSKYESGCGWPSFTRPIEPAHIVELTDTTHGMIRTEVVTLELLMSCFTILQSDLPIAPNAHFFYLCN